MILKLAWISIYTQKITIVSIINCRFNYNYSNSKKKHYNKSVPILKPVMSNGGNKTNENDQDNNFVQDKDHNRKNYIKNRYSTYHYQHNSRLTG